VNRADPSGLDWVWNDGSSQWDYVDGTPKETPKPTWTPGELPIMYVDAAIYKEIHSRTTQYAFQSGPFTPSPLGVRGDVIVPAGGSWAHIFGQNPAGSNGYSPGSQPELWATGFLDRERNRAVGDAWMRRNQDEVRARAEAEAIYQERKVLAYTGAAAIIAIDIATIPSGEGVAGTTLLMAWARGKALQAGIGAGIGATDAYLHDQSVWDGTKGGALMGMVFGSAGRLATYGGAPAVSLFYGGTAVMGGMGAYDSFEQGNWLGGGFRSVTTALSLYPALAPGHFLRGVGNDRNPRYFGLGLKDKLLYEVGQRTEARADLVPTVAATDAIAAAIARGRITVDKYGWSRALRGGSASLGLNEGTLSTGPTPGVRWVLPFTSSHAAGNAEVFKRHAYEALGLE